MFKKVNPILILIAVLLLSGTLVASAYASYNGIGLIPSGSPSARAGSIWYPFTVGGGPGGGK